MTQPASKRLVTEASLPTVSRAAPSGVGARTGTFDTNRHVYNPAGGSIDKARAIIASAAADNSRVKVAYIGTSIVAGYGGTPGTDSLPVMLGKLLGARIGARLGSGIVPAVNGVPGDPDDSRFTYTPTEWPYTGGVRIGNLQLHRNATGAGKTFTFTSRLKGTVADLYIFGNSTTFSYSIDGGAAVPVTPNGQSALQIITATGLSDATHTVSITSTGTGTTYLLGIGVRYPTGLEVAGFGVFGTVVNDWLKTNQFFDAYNDVIGYGPTLAIVQLGANEAIHSIGAATLKTNLTTLVDRLKTASIPVVLVVDPPIEDATVTNWATDFRSAIYDVADTKTVPLVDLTDAWGSRAAGAGLGYYFDQYHPTPQGSASMATILANALT